VYQGLLYINVLGPAGSVALGANNGTPGVGTVGAHKTAIKTKEIAATSFSIFFPFYCTIQELPLHVTPTVTAPPDATTERATGVKALVTTYI
jgi:hypothetical protein